MANNILKRLLGGDPAGVAIRLVIASVVVGFILAAVGANPVDLWKGLFRRIGDTFEAAVDNFGSVTTTLVSYLALGAVLVVPTWFVWRLVFGRSRGGRD